MTPCFYKIITQTFPLNPVFLTLIFTLEDKAPNISYSVKKKNKIKDFMFSSKRHIQLKTHWSVIQTKYFNEIIELSVLTIC